MFIYCNWTDIWLTPLTVHLDWDRRAAMMLRFGNSVRCSGKGLFTALGRRYGDPVVVRLASSSSGGRDGSSSDSDHNVETETSARMKQYDTSTAEAQQLHGEQIHDFSPAWTRDGQGQEMAQIGSMTDMQNTTGMQPPEMVQADTYQHSSNVSLYGVMQSQVPHPCASSPTHLNMPCGGHQLQQKYISGMLNDTHPTRNFSPITGQRSPEVTGQNSDKFTRSKSEASTSKPEVSSGSVRRVSTSSGSRSSGSKPIHSGGSPGADGQNQNVQKLSQKDKLKKAVKEYGSTVIVFHVGISLISLGGFYMAVSRYVEDIHPNARYPG